MTILKDAMEKAQLGLARAQHLMESANVSEGAVEACLMDTLSDLLEDLVPLLDKEKKTPAWLIDTDKVIDYEVLTVISQELASIYGCSGIHIEDSRSLEKLCREAAEFYTEYHFSEDPEYWQKRCFLDEVERFVSEIKEALLKRPEWINSEHNSMHGKETVRDLLERHMKEKYPVRLLDPIKESHVPVLAFKYNGLNVFVDTETAQYRIVGEDGSENTGVAWRTGKVTPTSTGVTKKEKVDEKD